MSDLLQTVKAVIDVAETYKKDFAPFSDEIRALRAAVERAGKQEAKPWTKPIPTDFKEWWETYALNKYGMGPAYHAWSAGQQAERERIKDIICEVTGGFGNCDRLMEKIDDVY